MNPHLTDLTTYSFYLINNRLSSRTDNLQTTHKLIAYVLYRRFDSTHLQLSTKTSSFLRINQPPSNKSYHTHTFKMKSQIIAASTLIAAAAAAPALQTRQSNSSSIPDNTPFGLLSLRSGSAVHLTPFSARKGGLALGVPAGEQGATCETETNTANFYLSEGALYLYTPSNVTQELYVDRSGMGQGVLQYSTTPGGYGAVRNAETEGWAIDSTGDLTFDGAGLLACPGTANSTEGPWSLWVGTGVTNPGGNVGCLGISTRAIEAAAPNACTYTFTPRVGA